MTMDIKKVAYLLYIGTQLARMHAISYITSFLNSVLWFLVLYIPVTVLSPNQVLAIKTFLPGVFGMTIASLSMWTATEFLRWYVYHGLTDMFRECGFSIIHYLVSALHIDVILFATSTYFASTIAAALAIGLDLSIMLPHSVAYFMMALIVAIPTYLLYGSLIGYLFTSTSIGGVWTSIFQMIITFGTIVPPSVAPDPRMLLINPATIVAELVRASYGTNVIDTNTLTLLTPITIVLYSLSAYLISNKCEKYIAKYGLKYRM